MKDRSLKLVLTCFSLALFNLAHAQGLRFTYSVQTTNGFSMQWSNGVAGQAYTLQARDRMTNSIWLTLDSPLPWPTVQTQWNDPISSAQSLRLYRVVGVQPAVRGKLISSNFVGLTPPTLLNFYLGYTGASITAQYGVDRYQIIYETIDPLGGRTTASGGLFVPQQTGTNWPLLSYSHGTITQTNQAPSVFNLRRRTPWQAWRLPRSATSAWRRICSAWAPARACILTSTRGVRRPPAWTCSGPAEAFAPATASA